MCNIFSRFLYGVMTKFSGVCLDMALCNRPLYIKQSYIKSNMSKRLLQCAESYDNRKVELH